MNERQQGFTIIAILIACICGGLAAATGHVRFWLMVYLLCQGCLLAAKTE